MFAAIDMLSHTSIVLEGCAKQRHMIGMAVKSR